jgi:hypothetical protein
MSEYFGQDDDSWNHEDDGKVGVSLFGNAVQVWAIFNANAGNPTSVADAAVAFAVHPVMIIEAINDHAWMFITGPDDDFTKMQIEHEGE